MNNLVSLLDLPNEILHLCAQHLSLGDLISLSETCQRLRHVCGLLNKCLDCHAGYDVSPSGLQQYFRACVNPALVTYCDFSHCYWISRSLLATILKKLVNLESLYVAETQLRCREISEILVKCDKVRHLSLSVVNEDDFWIEKPVYGLSIAIGEYRSGKSYMEACQSSLSNLKELHVYNCYFLNALSALLSLCSVLEDLRMVFFSQPGLEIPHRNRMPPDNLQKLKCLTVLVSREDAADELFMISLQIYFMQLVQELRELKWCWFHLPKPWSGPTFRSEFSAPFHQIEAFCCPWFPTRAFVFNANALTSLGFVDGVQDTDGGFPRLRHLAMHHVEDLLMEVALDLVQSSPLLEVLNLRCKTIAADQVSEKIKNLRVLNLSAAIFSAGFLYAIVKNCPQIQDLTLTCSTVSGPFPEVQDSELARIAQLSSLKRLSLECLQVRTGNFLVLILNDCRQLESLTLKDIGPSGLCCYSNQLTVNISAAQNLKHLLVSQKNMVLIPKLLDAMENCKALRQLGLVLPSNADPFKFTQENFKKRMHRLVSRLPKLVALHCLFSVPKVHCVKATTFLRESFSKERPAFYALLQMSMSWESLNVPLIHRKIFVPEESPQIVCPNSINMLNWSAL